MTPAERLLWERLRRKQLGVPFYRQKPLGPFIVDFYCPAAQLVIELDGAQHHTAEGMAHDAERTQYLEAMGLQVLRFENGAVMERIEGVVVEIQRKIPPHPPFFKGG